MNLTRRETLATLGTTVLLNPVTSLIQAAEKTGHQGPHIATNSYPWRTFAERDKYRYKRHTDALLKQIASTGIQGYEPIIENPDECDGLGERLKTYDLEMRSIYVSSILHDDKQSDDSIESVIAIAKAAQKLGTKIIVTNPSPLIWGGTEDKSDAQLLQQGKALDQLGAEIRKLGLTLAYHNHDAELRQGGREFHHMLTVTKPENLKFCLDAHWVFRGCGNSQIALFDAVSHYASRIVELHLRQSKGGVWTEVFSPTGDIDYLRLFASLQKINITPHFVLEQCIEEKSQHQTSVVEAHRKGRRNLLEALV